MHTISTNEGLIYFHLHSNGRHKASSFLGGGEGSGHAFLYVLRDLASHIRRPIQQYNIYNHPSVTICAAITKIPHVLYERSLLKTRKWWMICIHALYTMNVMGMGEKPRNKWKTRKKIPVWLPSHPPVSKIGGRLFSGAKGTENKPGLP